MPAKGFHKPFQDTRSATQAQSAVHDEANAEEIKGFVKEQARKRSLPLSPISGDESNSVLMRRAQRGNATDHDELHLQKLIDSDMELEEIKRSEYYQRCKRKLTRRQEVFLDGLLRGNTMVGAYRAAYNVANTRSHASVFSDAWKLAQHPLIILEMRAVASQRHELRVKSAHEIREYVIERLLNESQNAPNDGARIRSLELLGKIAEVGMFVNRSEHTTKREDPEELKQALVKRLQEFFRVNAGKNDAEDVQAIEDTSKQSKGEGEQQQQQVEEHADPNSRTP